MFWGGYARTTALLLVLFGAAASFPLALVAQEGEELPYVDESYVDDANLLSAEEIRAIVAPVALYPDDLLAVVLPAATNPLQIVQAGRYLEKHKADSSLQPDPEWDPAILALLNYPEVIEQMNADLDWTEQLGNALLDQQSDVLDMIQQIRAEATATGYLHSDEKQVVQQQGETVVIQSAEPEVVYVPTYDPAVVVEQNYADYPPPTYYDPYPSYYAPGATFFAGALTGAVFAYGFDWDDDDIDIDCCDGDFDGDDIDFDRGDVNIDRGDINVDRSRTTNIDASRFNAESRTGQGKMKWSSQKARTKSTTTKQTRKRTAPTGVAPAGLNQPSFIKPSQSDRTPPRAGDIKAQLKSKPSKSLGTYQTGKTTTRESNRGQKSLSSSGLGSSRSLSSSSNRSQGIKAAKPVGQQQFDRSSSRSSSAFSGSRSSGQRVGASSSRGNRSIKMTSRPSRSGGRR